MCASKAFFLPRPTGWMIWLMRCTVVLRGVTCTLCGSFSSVAARSRISSLKVAENKRLCLSRGTRASTFFTSWMKPMSNIRSASSSTRICTWPRSSMPCWCRSSRRPGVATSKSTPRLSLAICGFMPTPPKITVLESSRYLPYVRIDSSIWAASSRVGVSIRARMPVPPNLLIAASLVDRRCRIGKVKAAVLPVPVCAPPKRSWPAKTRGMACAWMAVGVS